MDDEIVAEHLLLAIDPEKVVNFKLAHKFSASPHKDNYRHHKPFLFDTADTLTIEIVGNV